MLTFYFDMDGVLAIFQRYDKEKFPTPPFMKQGSHYFLHRMTDPKAMRIFQTLYGPQTPNAQVHILTRILDESDEISQELQMEWWTDKRAWVLSNTTGVDTSTCFLTSGKDKGLLLKDVPDKQRKYHILIDDFNPNLRNWQAAGGTAVKYINDINSPESFDGMCLLRDWTAEQCVNALLALQVLA